MDSLHMMACAVTEGGNKPANRGEQVEVVISLAVCRPTSSLSQLTSCCLASWSLEFSVVLDPVGTLSTLVDCPLLVGRKGQSNLFYPIYINSHNCTTS